MKALIGIIVVAAIGGVFSNMVDIARRLQLDSANLPSSTYFIGCVIWAVLGVAVALIWGEKNLRRVFYLGVGLPSLLQLNIGNLSQAPSPDQNSSATSYIGAVIPAAYAKPPDLDIQGRTITFTRTERSPSSEGYRVIFYSSAEKSRAVISIDFKNQIVPVPDDAASLTVEFQGSQSGERIALPGQPNAAMKVQIDIQKKGWSGFLQSIGVRSASPYAVHVRAI